MGVRLRFGVLSILGLVTGAATVLAVACGGDDGGGGPADCTGAGCDGGALSETSTRDGSTPDPDGNTLPNDGAPDVDADSSVVMSCGDGGAPGALDQSFGDGGMVWLKYPTSAAHAVVIQADGKIVLGGYSSPAAGDRLAVARLLQDGTLDSTFGTNGLVETAVGTVNPSVEALALQADGKIIAAGRTRESASAFRITLLRHLPNGALDATFGNGGVVLTSTPSNVSAKAVALQADGRIIVAGNKSGSSADFVVQRYNVDGSLDSTFGTGGTTSIDFRGTADFVGGLGITAGKIVVGGYSVDPIDANRADMAVARLGSDGTLDATFGTGGRFVSSFGGAATPGYAATVDSNGRVLLGGAFKSASPDDIAVGRLTAAGTADPTWADGGIAITDLGGRNDVSAAVLVQADGRVISAGSSSTPGGAGDTQGISLVRYLSTGKLDPTFGSAGTTFTPPTVANTNLGAQGAALGTCAVVTVGTWGYNLTTVADTAMGIARYRR